MHLRKSTETPRGLLAVFAALEILIALSFFGAFLLRERLNPFYLVLQYLATLIHRCIMAEWATVALWRANRRGVARGCGILGLFLALLTLRDFLGNTVEQLFLGTYDIGGCLLFSLGSTLLNTTLLEGAILFFSFGLSYLLFLSYRPPSPPFSGFFRLRENPLTCATALFVGLTTLRYFISQIVSTVRFGITYDWMLRVSEVLSILLDFFMLFLAAVLSYLCAGWMRNLFLSEEDAPDTSRTSVSENKNK